MGFKTKFYYTILDTRYNFASYIDIRKRKHTTFFLHYLSLYCWLILDRCWSKMPRRPVRDETEAIKKRSCPRSRWWRRDRPLLIPQWEHVDNYSSNLEYYNTTAALFNSPSCSLFWSAVVAIRGTLKQNWCSIKYELRWWNWCRLKSFFSVCQPTGASGLWG